MKSKLSRKKKKQEIIQSIMNLHVRSMSILQKFGLSSEFLSIYSSNQFFLRQLAGANLSKMGTYCFPKKNEKGVGYLGLMTRTRSLPSPNDSVATRSSPESVM